MVRVNLKGVHPVPKRLADGTVKRYYYAWKGGPRLVGEPGSAEFIASYEAAHRTRRTPPPGTLHKVIADFKISDEFKGLKPRTQKDYLRHISTIEQKFSTLPLAALDDPRINRVLLEWRNKLPGGARQADYAYTVLTRILSWARDCGLTSWRAPARVKKLYYGDRSEKIWLPEHIAAFLAVCSTELRLALSLALDTGQRQGDLLMLPWSAYDGEWIRLKQRKTGQKVEIPVTADLKALLEKTPRRSPIIMTNTKGRPWKEHGFSSMWRRAKDAAGIKGLTFNDLRGTAVVRLAEAGCTIPQIASITGHSFKSAAEILERYLPRTRGLALAAITKLERGKK